MDLENDNNNRKLIITITLTNLESCVHTLAGPAYTKTTLAPGFDQIKI